MTKTDRRNKKRSVFTGVRSSVWSERPESGKSRFLEDIEYIADGDTVTGRRIWMNGTPVGEKQREAWENHFCAYLSQTMNYVMELTCAEFLQDRYFLPYAGKKRKNAWKHRFNLDPRMREFHCGGTVYQRILYHAVERWTVESADDRGHSLYIRRAGRSVSMNRRMPGSTARK